jgi:uncharacterized protein involved in copper resistance
MRRGTYLALLAVLPSVAFAAGCGGDQTTASKSAAAFDEAQRKGAIPSGGEAHGHHGAAEATKGGSAAGQDKPPQHAGHDAGGSAAGPGGAATGMDHSAMRGMEHSATTGAGRSVSAGMDHSRMSGMDHGNMARFGTASTRRQAPRSQANAPAAGMNHSRMDHSNMPGMAGAQRPRSASTPAGTPGQPRAPQAHANMPGMDRSKMAQAPVGAAPPVPERPAAVASPDQLVATLRPDPLDVPEPTAIREAARSAEMAQRMAGGGHGMSHGTYRQIDAGRDEVTPMPSGHQMTPAPPPPSTAKPHDAHPAPAPATPTQAVPAPSADPHAGHVKPAAPRPSPTPSPRPTPTPRPKEDNR